MAYRSHDEINSQVENIRIHNNWERRKEQFEYEITRDMSEQERMFREIEQNSWEDDD